MSSWRPDERATSDKLKPVAPYEGTIRPQPRTMSGVHEVLRSGPSVTWVVAAGLSIAAASWGLSQFMETRATHDYVDKAILEHAHEATAHHDLEARQAAQRATETAQTARDEVYFLFWVKVGEKAAELVPSRQRVRRAKAADDARVRFERLVSRGAAPDEAFRRVLDTGVP